MVKKCDGFLDLPIDQAGAVRRERAARLLAFDDAVVACVAALKDRGMQSAYLKPFVVARFNPLRFAKAGTTADFDETLERVMAKAAAFDAAAIKPGDLAAAAYAGGGGEED
jgi:ParB family chromosome partitioning protein